LFSGLGFAALVVLSSTIYFALLWLFRAISTEEIAGLINKKGEEAREYETVP